MALLFLALSGAVLAAENPAPSVGVARMLPDGIILVGIRGPDSQDSQAQAVLVVEPGDSNYQRIVDHIGGLKPGETKSIPPWPDSPPPPPPQNNDSPPQR